MPNITPNWNFLPFMGTVGQLIGGVEAVSFVLILGLWFLAGISWAGGSISGNFGMVNFGKAAFWPLLLVAIAMGAAYTIINWAIGVGQAVH